MLPRVVLHNAVSLDGHNDGFPVDMGQFYGVAARWKENATLVGSETILKGTEAIGVPPEDETAFEPPVRNPRDKRPLLAIADSGGRVRCWHMLRQAPYWRDCVALCSRKTPRDYLDYLKKRHIHALIVGEKHVDLRQALRRLNTRFGVKVVRVDAGGTLNGLLLQAGLVNEISLVVHPVLVGGTTPHPFVSGPDLVSPQAGISLRLSRAEKLKGGLLWLRYTVSRP